MKIPKVTFYFLTKFLFLLPICWTLLVGEGYGQTYTTTGNSTNWNDVAAWTRANPAGCGSTANIPPLGPVWNANCPVFIIINHEITFSGTANIGGGEMVSLTVNAGGQMNFNGNLTINNSGGKHFVFNVLKDGKLKVSNQLMLNGIAFLNIKGEFEANTINSSAIGVSQINVSSSGKLKVIDKLTVNNYFLNVSDTAQVAIGGNFEVTRSGPGSVNIKGQSNFLVKGNTSISSPVKAYGNSFITFESDVILPNTGHAIFETYGKSDVLIQGNLSIGNSGGIKTFDESSLVICDQRIPVGIKAGSFPAPPGPNGNVIVVSPTSYYGGCRILPVDFLYMEAQFSPQKQSSLLTWATAKEWENSHFEIERSVEGIKDFEKVGEVEGMGWKDTVTDYKFEDKNIPLAASTVYYRLKQVDFNGEYDYSKVLSIRMPSLQVTKDVWSVYPNPTTGEAFSLALSGRKEYEGEDVHVRLFSATAGSRTFVGTDMHDLSLGIQQILLKSPLGIYVVEISWGRKIEYIKVLKQ